MKFHPWFAAALLAMSGMAQASVTLYSDAASYNAALISSGNVAPSVSADFASAAAANGVTDSYAYGVVDPNSIVVGALTFSGLNNGNAASFLTQNTYGVTGAFFDHETFNQGLNNTLTITFASPITAVAFVGNVSDVFSTGSAAVPIVLTTDTGDVVQSYSSALYNWSDYGTPAPEVFNGLISDKPFTSLTISAQVDAIAITSISTAAAPVPEPDVAMLALAGLGIVGFAARRKGLKAIDLVAPGIGGGAPRS